MEFQQVVRRRRMVRDFLDRPLPPGTLDRILHNATRAPSAGFSQGWAFLGLEGKEQTEPFWDAVFGEDRGEDGAGLYRAPAVVVPLSHKRAYLERYAESDKGWTDRDESRWPVPFWDIDTGMASMLMLLTAVDEGLGALFFGVWRIAELRAAFGIPDDYTPIGAIVIGYQTPGEQQSGSPKTRARKEDVIHRGRWGG